MHIFFLRYRQGLGDYTVITNIRIGGGGLVPPSTLVQINHVDGGRAFGLLFVSAKPFGTYIHFRLSFVSSPFMTMSYQVSSEVV
jgi:hypothetical protein